MGIVHREKSDDPLSRSPRRLIRQPIRDQTCAHRSIIEGSPFLSLSLSYPTLTELLPR